MVNGLTDRGKPRKYHNLFLRGAVLGNHYSTINKHLKFALPLVLFSGIAYAELGVSVYF